MRTVSPITLSICSRQQAATDACSFLDDMGKTDFLADKRTQQAAIMSLIIIGEAATQAMDNYTAFTQAPPQCHGATCAECAIGLPMAI